MSKTLQELVTKPHEVMSNINQRILDLKEVFAPVPGCTPVEGTAAQAFELFDTDHDGVISPEQFVKVTNALGYAGSSHALLQKALEADLDGNGEIDFGEFVAVMTENTGGSDGSVKSAVQRFRTTFKLFDTSHTGEVGAVELRTVLRSLGLRPTDVELQQMTQLGK